MPAHLRVKLFAAGLMPWWAAVRWVRKTIFQKDSGFRYPTC